MLSLTLKYSKKHQGIRDGPWAISFRCQQVPLQNFDRDLGENLGEFLAGEIAEISVRSRRDLGEISKTRQDSRRDLGEISKSLRHFRRDLGEILKSWQPKTRRDSRRDLKISSRFSPRSQRDLKISAAKDSPRISTRFQVRS